MEIFHPSIILIAAFILDLIFGDPNYRCHPVRIMGNFIGLLQKKIKDICPDNKLTGVCLALLAIFFSVSIYSAFYYLLNRIYPAAVFLLNIYFVYSLIALKDLFNHCRPVIIALDEKNLKKARESIGMIVGRDVNYLDEAGIIRAAVETLAENFVDGFFSPVFWYGLGCIAGVAINIDPLYSGVVFLIIFKAASTLDSMVGYKTKEFINTGWAGAKLDDLMNFIPARLSLIVLFFGAALSGADPIKGLNISIRDRLKHESPNSAHSESFVAGAIKSRLGGPTRYRDGVKEKPWLGEEFSAPSIGHIKQVIRLLMFASIFTVLIFFIILNSFI